MDSDVMGRVRDLLNAQESMLQRWAESSEDGRRDLWERLHSTADRVRDELDLPYQLR